ncbi:hypothetical protein [Mycolicibacterium sp.]|uniref:hypothetical protein n=1 Tax=Mycolicibacterium sp. TaxID=2320850 RepID=UPI0037CADC7B
MRPSAALQEFGQRPHFVALGRFAVLARPARKKAKAQAREFGAFDEQRTRELVQQLNDDTARYGRAEAMLRNAHNPVVNKWATFIRFAADESTSGLGDRAALLEDLRTGKPTELPANVIRAWNIVYARDARVFVNGCAPPKNKREDYWHCYLQKVLWHREREQWEMPYRYNEFEKQEEAARKGTLADRPAADPGAEKLWAQAKSIAAELGEAVTEWEFDPIQRYFERPLLADVTEPLTADWLAAHAIMTAALPDNPQNDPVKAKAAIDAAERAHEAWVAAWRYAGSIGLGTLPTADRRRMTTAQKLLTSAADHATTPAERASCIDRVVEILAEVTAVDRTDARRTVTTHVANQLAVTDGAPPSPQIAAAAEKARPTNNATV